jgi:hypothetical protein
MDVRSFFGRPMATTTETIKTKTETKTKTIKTKTKTDIKGLINTLINVLEEQDDITAREIANKANSDKHVVNQVLYATPDIFVQTGKKSNAPLWGLVEGFDEQWHTEQCECGAYLGGRRDWTEEECDEHPDREPGYDLDGQWWCPEHRKEEEEMKECQLCHEKWLPEETAGCCNDGDCPHHIETMCAKCGVWSEEEEVWRCDKCAEEDAMTYGEREEEKPEPSKAKAKTACPQCGKEFLNMELHRTKAHKRDKWRVVIPADLGDDWTLFLYGEEVSKEGWGGSGSGTKGSWLETYFGRDGTPLAFREELERARSDCVIVELSTNEDGDKPLAKDRTSVRLLHSPRPRWEGEATPWLPIDPLTWIVEFE